MAIEGRLGAGGVADLLAALWHSERTAILDLEVAGVERKFALANGAVVYVTSSDAGEKLAVRLVGQGACSREQIIAASRAGGDLRDALQAVGAAPEGYDRVMRDLLAEVIGKVFAATQGTYAVHDRAELGLQGTLSDLDMTSVLWGAARSCPPDFAAGFVGALGSRVTKTGGEELLADLPDLSPQEGFLISRIDGYGAVDDLLSVLPLPKEQVLRLVVGLVLVGYADVQGRPGVKLPRPAKTTGSRKKAASSKPATTTRPAPAHVISTAGIISVTPEGAPEPELEGVDGARVLHAKTAGRDHYGVLDVKQDASDDEVRKAYYRLARLYHPDRFGNELPEKDREVVEDLFARISDAFSSLSSPEKRQEYDARLTSGALAAEQKEAAKPVDRKELARTSFDKARALMASGDRTRALAFLEHAVETDPESWDYRIGLARLLMSESRLRKRAEQHLLEAVRIDSTKADSYLLLGQLYKLGGVKSRALEQFREGLRWDSSHAGILKELAELGESGSEESAGGGLLGGLFKKK